MKSGGAGDLIMVLVSDDPRKEDKGENGTQTQSEWVVSALHRQLLPEQVIGEVWCYQWARRFVDQSDTGVRLTVMQALLLSMRYSIIPSNGRSARRPPSSQGWLSLADHLWGKSIGDLEVVNY